MFCNFWNVFTLFSLLKSSIAAAPELRPLDSDAAFLARQLQALERASEVALEKLTGGSAEPGRGMAGTGPHQLPGHRPSRSPVPRDQGSDRHGGPAVTTLGGSLWAGQSCPPVASLPGTVESSAKRTSLSRSCLLGALYTRFLGLHWGPQHHGSLTPVRSWLRLLSPGLVSGSSP